MNIFSQDVEIKEEGARHMLILFNCKKDMAGGVDFLAANAKSSAQLRVKGNRNNTLVVPMAMWSLCSLTATLTKAKLQRDSCRKVPQTQSSVHSQKCHFLARRFVSCWKSPADEIKGPDSVGGC